MELQHKSLKGYRDGWSLLEFTGAEEARVSCGRDLNRGRGSGLGHPEKDLALEDHLPEEMVPAQRVGEDVPSPSPRSRGQCSEDADRGGGVMQGESLERLRQDSKLRLQEAAAPGNQLRTAWCMAVYPPLSGSMT